MVRVLCVFAVIAVLVFAGNSSMIAGENPKEVQLGQTGESVSASLGQYAAPRANPVNITSTIMDIITGASTSGNARAPIGTFNYERVAWIITAGELAAAGFPVGTVNAIGFNYSVAPSIAVTGNLTVYLENTSDVTFTRGTSWATITSTMTAVHNASITLPAATGILDIPFSGGSPFSYTGGGLYVAFDYSNPSNPLSTGTVVLCNTALANGLAGAQANNPNPAPTTLAASSFRPWTRLGTTLNDIIKVPVVYALGKIPIPYGVPQTISVPVQNLSTSSQTLDVFLTVKDAVTSAVRFTDTQVGVTVSAGSTTVVSFAPWSPTITENDSLIVTTSTIPGEDITANNRAVMVQNVNTHRFAYSQGPTPTGGVGFTGATGDFVAKFVSGTSAVIDSIQVNFSASSATQKNYKLAIWDATGAGGTPGNNIYTSDSLTSVAGVVTIPINPPVAVNGFFYLGVKQLTTTNVSFSFQNENPIRPSTFYYTSPTGGATWTDFAPGSPFRFMIEANIALGSPMVYASSTTTQNNTAPVPPGGTNKQVIGMEVVTTGNLLPINVTQFDLNTTGTTNPATDISNARIYYTGTNSTFAPINQFGVTVASPSGPYVVTGTRSLASGTNYFWLTYDINPGATAGNVIDGECTSVTVAGVPRTPTVTAPTGSRQIKNALAGSYTVGLAMFNRVSGRSLYAVKQTRRVMREVPVPSTEPNAKGKGGESRTSLITGTKWMEVEEEYSVLMENGKPVTGRIVAPLTGAQRTELGLGDNILAVYPTITAALADLNGLGVSGPVTFLLVDSSYPSETYPLTINSVAGASASNTITIRPQTAVATTVPGNSASCIFKLNGADYVTIDGSNSGGTDRSMTISNANTTTSSAVIWIASVASPRDSATNNTIKNCIISGNSGTTTFIGIVTSGSTLGGLADAQNIGNTVRNNAISKSYYGVATVGPSGNESGLLITQNTIGVTDTIGFNGIALFQQQNAVVSKNTISKVVSATSATASGIRFSGTADSVLVNANTISDIKNTNTVGWGSNGIQLNCSIAGVKVSVMNNFIQDVAAYGYDDGTVLDNGYGIIAVTGGGYRIYNNSVNMNANQTVVGRPAAFNASVGVTNGGIDVRDNIFVNSQTIGDTARYAIYCAGGDTLFSLINYNDYYTLGPNLGFLAGTVRPALSDWRTATGQDLNSVSGDPLFLSSTDLHITNTSSPVSNAGTPIAGVTTDHDGDVRSVSTPDMGADEFGSTTTSINVALISGWNMISNPVTSPIPGDSVRQLFPTSLNAYAFEYIPGSGYSQRFRLENRKGYWGKFPAATTQPITGTPLTRDTLNVLAGWNMVGTISNPVDTNTIVSIPPGLRASSWFGYAAGYSPVTQLTPGKGYWVKANAVGKFVIANPPLGAAAKSQAPGGDVATLLNSLTITDSKGGSQTLYFGAEKEIPLALYALPPAPPVGAFDARFETPDGGSMVQTHPADGREGLEFTVAIQSVAYPLTVSWKVTRGSYALTDCIGGKALQARDMAAEGSIQIANPDVSKLAVRLVGAGGIPTEFALSQNYPNPFNPTTNIKYALPVDSKVTVHIYNVLGQRIRTLINGDVAAGYHSAEWDGRGSDGQQLASGVYFLQLSANGTNGKSFSELRKLMMLK